MLILTGKELYKGKKREVRFKAEISEMEVALLHKEHLGTSRII